VDKAATLEFDFALAGAGWADLTIRADRANYEIGSISYLGSALDELIRLGIDIATDRGFGFARFDHEPGSTILFAECSWWDEEAWVSGHRISVIDWPGIGGRDPAWCDLREAPRLFMVEVESRDAISGAILATAERILASHGVEGYSKLWRGRLGFPVRALAALRAALAVPAVAEEGWNG
jgi:hypothetical protein